MGVQATVMLIIGSLILVLMIIAAVLRYGDGQNFGLLMVSALLLFVMLVLLSTFFVFEYGGGLGQIICMLVLVVGGAFLWLLFNVYSN